MRSPKLLKRRQQVALLDFHELRCVLFGCGVALGKELAEPGRPSGMRVYEAVELWQKHQFSLRPAFLSKFPGQTPFMDTAIAALEAGKLDVNERVVDVLKDKRPTVDGWDFCVQLSGGGVVSRPR